MLNCQDGKSHIYQIELTDRANSQATITESEGGKILTSRVGKITVVDGLMYFVLTMTDAKGEFVNVSAFNQDPDITGKYFPENSPTATDLTCKVP